MTTFHSQLRPTDHLTTDHPDSADLHRGRPITDANFLSLNYRPPNQLFIKQDLRQFETLFKQLFKPLCGFAMKYVGDLDDAKSVVHEAFINVWEKFDSLPPDTNFRSYLYTAVKNRSLNHVRDRKKHVRLDEVPEDMQSENTDSLVTGELEREIELAIESLPEKCREVFEMNRKDGLKYLEIAEKLGISVKTVEAQMSKALSVLRERLGEFLAIILFILWE